MSCVTLMELTAQGSKEPVNVMSIVSSGSYLPYRAAIESRRDIAFEIEHAALSNEVSYRYRTVESTITSANSIALVMAQRATDEAGATVAVTFDTSEGPLYFSRDLDLSFDFKPQLGSTPAVRGSYSAA
jgi:hypothetical protein